MRLPVILAVLVSAIAGACADAPRRAAAPYTPTPEEQRKIDQWADCVVPRAFMLDDGKASPEAIARQATQACRHLSMVSEAKETAIIVRVVTEKREKERKAQPPAGPSR